MPTRDQRRKLAAKKAAANRRANSKASRQIKSEKVLILNQEETLRKVRKVLRENGACGEEGKWSRVVAKEFFGVELKTFEVKMQVKSPDRMWVQVQASSAEEAERLATDPAYLTDRYHNQGEEDVAVEASDGPGWKDRDNTPWDGQRVEVVKVMQVKEIKRKD